jgi:hypothetical protein
MKINKKIKSISKKLLIGRNSQLIDKIIFYFSNKNYSGWLLGNQIRSLIYGKKKSVCNEPLILIGGFPRSGTTLLRAILEQSKDIASPETEIHLLQET